MELPFGTLIRDRHRTINNFQSDRSSKDTSIACRVDVFDQVDRSSHSYDDCPAPKRNHWKVKRCVLVARVTNEILMGRNESEQRPSIPSRQTNDGIANAWNRCPWSESRPTANWLSAENFVRVRCKFLSPSRSTSRLPYQTIYPRGSLAVPVQTVYSLLHAPSSSLKREQSNGGARVTRLDLCEW